MYVNFSQAIQVTHVTTTSFKQTLIQQTHSLPKIHQQQTSFILKPEGRSKRPVNKERTRRPSVHYPRQIHRPNCSPALSPLITSQCANNGPARPRLMAAPAGRPRPIGAPSPPRARARRGPTRADDPKIRASGALRQRN